MTAQVFFGGSFDPPHMGHLIIASEVLEELKLDSLIFVPVAQNPFKDRQTGASGADRLEMLRLMTAGDDRFAISSHEVDRSPPSRSYDTVTTLIDQGLLVKDPWMVLGDELIHDLPRWYRSEELLKAVRLAVVLRDHHGQQTQPSEEEEISAGIEAMTGRYHLVKNPHIGISSRNIRQRLQEGRSIRYLVPDAVYEYIRDHSLYR
jgi:nicotinate-nucleotide adenylyltransferase